MRSFIEYRAGFKYQLQTDYGVQLSFKPDKLIQAFYVVFYPDGRLIVKRGYAWDGPSGPTINTVNFMRGSLVHDVIYQLMRQGHLTKDYRLFADRELKKMCLEDGMWRIRAWWVFRALRRLGNRASLPSSTKRVFRAP